MKGIRLASGAVFVSDGRYTVRLLSSGACDISPVAYEVLEWDLRTEPPDKWEYLTESEILALPGGAFEKIRKVLDASYQILEQPSPKRKNERKQNKYQLGLVSISFRKQSPEEILKAIKEAGLSCVEWGSDVHAPCGDIKRLREIAHLQKAYGIDCSSYGTYFRLGQTPVSELKAYIKAAKILGTNILRLWCGTNSGADMTKQEKEFLFAECHRAAEIAKKNGVILCMECHSGTFTQYPEDAVELMNTINSPHFRMYWQPFQWLDAEGSLAVARAVAPYTEHIHVFNWRGGERLPLDEGIQEWRSYLTAFPAPCTLLLEFMPDDRIESLSAEAAALKTIIKD